MSGPFFSFVAAQDVMSAAIVCFFSSIGFLNSAFAHFVLHCNLSAQKTPLIEISTLDKKHRRFRQSNKNRQIMFILFFSSTGHRHRPKAKEKKKTVRRLVCN